MSLSHRHTIESAAVDNDLTDEKNWGYYNHYDDIDDAVAMVSSNYAVNIDNKMVWVNFNSGLAYRIYSEEIEKVYQRFL